MLITIQWLTAFHILFNFSLEVQGFENIFIDDGIDHINEIFFNATIGLRQSQVETHWFNQPLDHFNSSIKGIWKMRYMKNLELWQPGGPIIIFIGGEWKIHQAWLLTGMLYSLATESKGALFYTEHRYYGESIPSKEFKYLSSIQAIADLAAVIRWLKSQKQFQSSKVLLVGGSYGANLAVWTKRLCPELVDASLASSGPILAKVDFFEYLETVGDNYKKYGTKGCYSFVQNQFDDYNNAFKTRAGIEKLKKEENICDYSDMKNEENQQAFILYKLSIFMNISQKKNLQIIQQHCDEMMDPELNKKNVTKSPETLKLECKYFDLEMQVEMLRDRTDYYHWFYQKCTEFGYFKTTTSNKHPFGEKVKIETYYKICKQLFGKEFNAETIGNAIKDINKLYGGLKPKVENVIFTNGELDPWHRLGVLKDLSKDAPAIFIPRVSHCRDLGPDLKDDSKELTQARKIIKETLKEWLGY